MILSITLNQLNQASLSAFPPAAFTSREKLVSLIALFVPEELDYAP